MMKEYEEYFSDEALIECLYNRHEPLPDFDPGDFSDFTRKVAVIWNIDLGWEGGLL